MPLALLTVILVEPDVAPPVMEVEVELMSPDPRYTAAVPDPRMSRVVLWAPAPRSVTLLGTLTLVLMRYLPCGTKTTCFAGQLFSAL